MNIIYIGTVDTGKSLFSSISPQPLVFHLSALKKQFQQFQEPKNSSPDKKFQLVDGFCKFDKSTSEDLGVDKNLSTRHHEQ